MAAFENALVFVYIGFLLVVAISLSVYLSALTFTRAPFLFFARRKLPEIISALRLAPGSVMYDLGSGDGRVLLAAAEASPAGRYVGIDYALAAHVAARWRYWRAGSPKQVTFLKKDFFAHDLSDATHVYCYLFPKLMEDLHQKFLRELKPGTRVVSCDFEIPGVVPTEVILFKRPAKLGKTLHVYQY